MSVGLAVRAGQDGAKALYPTEQNVSVGGRGETTPVASSAPSPTGYWPPSLGELRMRAWEERCALFTHLSSAIASDINGSARPGELLRKGDPEQEVIDRAERMVAFGQFAESVHAANEHLANAGLFGTSAAIEALALCVGSDHIDDSLKPGFQRSAVLAWNFIDVAAALAGADRDSKYFWQFRSTLRTCHVLRAAAAVRPLLTSIEPSDTSDAERADPQQVAAIDDFQPTFDNVVRTCTSTLMESCAGPATSPDGLPAWIWRFGVEDKDQDPLGAVRNADQAVYVVSSVLIAVVRAHSAGIVGHDMARQLFPTERRDWLIDILLDPSPTINVDPRFKLFGLWALSHLDDTDRELHPLGLRVGSSALGYTVPGHLTLGAAFNHGRFVAQVDRTVTDVLADPARLVEVQSDYRMVINGYRRDYFAVPVVPVLLMLASRYKSSWLFRRSVGRILERTTAKASDAPLPYQLSAGTNGVVFMSYLLGAACAARQRLWKMTLLRRVKHWLPAMTYQDNFKAVGIAGLLVLLGGPGAYFLIRDDDTGLGILLGAWIGLVLNILVVPFNNMLWRRSA